MRRAPVGGVWALAANEQSAQALTQQANNLDALERPVILTGPVSTLNEQIDQQRTASDQEQVTFDVIIGRNVFTQLADKKSVAKTITNLLKPEGRLVLAEIIPQHTQRLHQLVDLSDLPAEMVERITAAEEDIYANPDDPMVNWNDVHLERIFKESGLTNIETFIETSSSAQRIGAGQIDRWFSLEPRGNRLSFAQHLLKKEDATGIDAGELETLKAVFQRQLTEKVVSWKSTIVYVFGHK